MENKYLIQVPVILEILRTLEEHNVVEILDDEFIIND